MINVKYLHAPTYLCTYLHSVDRPNLNNLNSKYALEGLLAFFNKESLESKNHIGTYLSSCNEEVLGTYTYRIRFILS